MTIDTAFLLAAGKGTRMAPLTETCPKPLVSLQGRPLLDYIADHLRAQGVKRIVINAHHHASQIADYIARLQGFDDVTLSHEDILMESGGGLKKAAPLLGPRPFFMINGDAFWTEGADAPLLSRLEARFDPARMDILLGLIPVAQMTLTEGVGDYTIAQDGACTRSRDKTGTHMFTGIRIVNPAILDTLPEGIYSFLQQMDEAEQKGRLYGTPHTGLWHHISTPQDIENVEKSLPRALSTQK